MKSALFALALVALSVAPAAAATSEAAFYADLAAFNSTNASENQCQTMIRYENNLKYTPVLGNSSDFLWSLVVATSWCLNAVRAETQDEMPARLPMVLNARACARYRSTAPNPPPGMSDASGQYCPAKSGR